MSQIIVFIGPEGSGKTVNAVRLSAKMKLPCISTGDIIRDLAANDYKTKYGDLCRKMFAEHSYLDGSTLLEILINRLSERDTENGFILDGGMRTLEETEKFQFALEKAGRDKLPLKVIMLKVPREVSLERLTGVNGRKRHDDTVERVNKRLDNFNGTLEQRLDIIKQNKNWEIVEIDATPSIESVYKTISAIFSV